MFTVSRRCLRRVAAVTALAACASPAGRAADLYNEDGLDIRWDNTFKYTFGIRTESADPLLTGPSAINEDDGDNSFKAGAPITDRLDVLSELDIRYGDYGFSGSADGWYDEVYNQRNQNDSPSTFNSVLIPNNKFTDATRRIEGDYVELGNAFVYGKTEVDDAPLNFRVGRYALVWGESLFAADNGIAYAQGPLDIIKATANPNTQAKELFLPVAQMSATLQLQSNLSIEAYEQFEWRKTRLPGAGSFFSTTDILDYGGERILVGPSPFPGAGPLAFWRANDDAGKALGQFGVAAHWQPIGNLDLGLYALHYDDKEPQVYVQPGVDTDIRLGRIGQYFLGYARNIELYGVSASSTLGDANYGFEVSARRHNDFQSIENVEVPGRPADFNNNPLYPVGDSLHYQANVIYPFTSTVLYDSATFLGEVFGSHILDISENKQNFPDDRRHTTLAFRGQFVPQYFQVLPGLDVSLPVGLGYNFLGRSGTTSVFNEQAAAHGGDLSVGLSGTYNNAWRGSINFTHFFGENKINPVTGYETAPYLDRDFLTFSISRTI